MSSPLPPWLHPHWERLTRARAAGRLTHALLVFGPAGVGKRLLVRALARGLLCSQPDTAGHACGRCPDCLLLAAGNHPDLQTVGPDPEGKSDEIRVDRIRALVESESLTAHRGRYKVVVVDPAHRMNNAAANGLLKTLEEPSPGTLLALISERPARLPATIRSRCQGLPVAPPPLDQARGWLAPQVPGHDPELLLGLAGGGPLRALTLIEGDYLAEREATLAGLVAIAQGRRDPLAEAGAWNQQALGIRLAWLAGLMGDILRLATGHPAPWLVNSDRADTLRALARRIEPRAGHRLFAKILRLRAVEDTSLNVLLTYESLLLAWGHITGRGRD